METTTDYQEMPTETKEPTLGKVNGKPYSRLALPFNIGNLVHFLDEKYGREKVTVSENLWLRKNKKPQYDLSINIDKRETAEEIKRDLHQKFGQCFYIGGHLNYESREKVHLFMAYGIGPEKMYLWFEDISVQL